MPEMQMVVIGNPQNNQPGDPMSVAMTKMNANVVALNGGSPVAIQGPAGPTGPVGEPGPQGAAGPAGAVGAQGAAGAMGLVGPAGPQGEAGPQGASGPVGPAGPQGVAGAVGATGPAGAEGAGPLYAWYGGDTAVATTFAAKVGALTYTSASPTAPTIPVLAATNLRTSTRRSTISTTAIAGTLAYIRGNQLVLWRGNAPGLGGFKLKTVFGIGAPVAGVRCFSGLVDSTAVPTGIEPTTATAPGRIGLAINANTGNWKLVHNVTGAAPTVIDLGASFPVNGVDLLDLTLTATPNAAAINYVLKNLTSGVSATGALTTNIPAAATFMTPSLWITNSATAGLQTLDFVQMEIFP